MSGHIKKTDFPSERAPHSWWMEVSKSPVKQKSGKTSFIFVCNLFHTCLIRKIVPEGQYCVPKLSHAFAHKVFVTHCRVVKRWFMVRLLILLYPVHKLAFYSLFS